MPPLSFFSASPSFISLHHLTIFIENFDDVISTKIAAIHHLSGMTGLEVLDLIGVELLQDEAQLLAGMPSLKELRVFRISLSAELHPCAWSKLGLVIMPCIKAIPFLPVLSGGIQIQESACRWCLGMPSSPGAMAAAAHALELATRCTVVSDWFASDIGQRLILIWSELPGIGVVASTAAAISAIGTLGPLLTSLTLEKCMAGRRLYL